jgi:hypothetical protein
MYRLFPHIFLITITAALVSPAQSARAASKWCLQGQGWGYPGNCQFATYRQCQATASGTFSECGINPAYAYARQHGRQRY